MSILNRIGSYSYKVDPNLLRAVLQGLLDAWYEPLPHALEHNGRLKLSGKHITERVNNYLLSTEQVTATKVGRVLHALGCEKRKATEGTRPMVVIYDQKLMRRLIAELDYLERLEAGEDVQEPFDERQVPAPPRYRRLKDMPLSDEQRAFVAEWLDYQLALVREYLLGE